MKKVILVLIIFLLLLIMPDNVIADSSDWTLVPIPGTDGDAFPVFFDTDTNLASDITTDINGNLYVMSGSRIIRFTPSGRLDISWGNNGIIYDDFIMRSNTEQLDIVADSRGYVYALCRICEDGSPTFLKRYAPNGKADVSWYGDGVMGGKFYEYNDGTYLDYYIGDDTAEPKGGIRYMDEVVLDSKDNLYVLHNRKVYRFLPDGKRDRKWHVVDMVQPQYEYDEGGDGVWFDNVLRIDWQDNVYLFNGYDQTVSKYNKSGKLIKKEKCGLYYLYEDEEYDESYYLINQVAFDAEGNIYSNDYVKDTISKYSAGFELLAGWLLSAQNYEKQQIDDFVSDRNGNIYTIDMERSIVSKYTSEGKAAEEWGFKGSIGNINIDSQAMLSFTDLIADTNGSMYTLSDYQSNDKVIITKLNADFTLDSKWGVKISNNTNGYKIDSFSSIAVNGGYLYIEPDFNSPKGVIRINKEGKEDPDWRIYLNEPVWGIQTDKNGHIYVADATNSIRRYLSDGSIDKRWGIEGVVREESSFMTEMEIDANGRLYISERENNSVYRYTAKGKLDESWGENGKIRLPTEDKDSTSLHTFFITVDDACNLYISDFVNNRILRYGSSGKPDTSWCDNGEWKSENDLSNSLMPMIEPTHIMIKQGRLYAIWNRKLYEMNESAAQVGTKTEAKPQITATAAPQTAEPGMAAISSNDEKPFDWKWIIGAGGLILCLGAALIICLILRKKKKLQDI